MSKWYEVKLTTVKIVAIELASDIPESAAIALALEDAAAECAPMSGNTEAEVESGPYADGSAGAELLKRHADEVLTLPQVA